jgi:hypothetical protein
MAVRMLKRRPLRLTQPAGSQKPPAGRAAKRLVRRTKRDGWVHSLRTTTTSGTAGRRGTKTALHYLVPRPPPPLHTVQRSKLLLAHGDGTRARGTSPTCDPANPAFMAITSDPASMSVKATRPAELVAVSEQPSSLPRLAVRAHPVLLILSRRFILQVGASGQLFTSEQLLQPAGARRCCCRREARRRRLLLLRSPEEVPLLRRCIGEGRGAP